MKENIFLILVKFILILWCAIIHLDLFLLLFVLRFYSCLWRDLRFCQKILRIRLRDIMFRLVLCWNMGVINLFSRVFTLIKQVFIIVLLVITFIPQAFILVSQVFIIVSQVFIIVFKEWMQESWSFISQHILL